MAGLKIVIDTDSAQRASAQLRKELSVLGVEAATNEKEFKKLETRLLEKMGADKASQAVNSLKKSLGLTRAETAKMQASVGDYNGAMKTMSANTGGAASALGMMKTAMIGVLGTMGTAELIRTADTWKLIEGRLRLVTSGTNELTSAQNKLFQIAQDTRQSFEQTGDLYSRIARSTKTLSLSQEQLLGITDTINKSLVISGASAQAADAALMQLGQAFASGTLRGEELNSVLEQAPRLAEAIAQGMGVEVGALRKLAAEGKITSKTMVDALSQGSDAAKKISAEFEKMEMTVGQSTVKVKNSLMKAIGEFDNATGASAEMARMLSFVADNMDMVVTSASILGAAALPATLLSVASAGKKAAVAIGLLNTAILANPAVLGATAFAGFTAAMYALYRETIKIQEDNSIEGISLKIKNLEEHIKDLEKTASKSGSEIQKSFLNSFGGGRNPISGTKTNAAIDATTESLSKAKQELVKMQEHYFQLIDQIEDSPAVPDPTGNNAKNWDDYEKKYLSIVNSTIEAKQKELEEYRKSENAKPELVAAAEAEIQDLLKKSAAKKQAIVEKSEKDAKQAQEKELKTLIEFNKKKYAVDIAAGKAMGRDSWLAREQGMKEAMERAIEYQEKETQAVYDAEQDRLKAAEDATKEHQKTVKDAHADMLDTIQDYTADIISDWDNAGDMLVDIAKRTAAEMAAAFISQQFIMPMVQTIGGAMGMSWNGVPMSAMGGVFGSGMNGSGGSSLPSGNTLSWIGNNVPGMGALSSAMAWNLPGTATIGSELGWGAAAAQDIGSISSAGTSLGTALGYGAMGGLGYQYIGGALGLPQSKYSGLTASVSGALGGTYAGAAMSGMGMAAAGASMGSVVPVIGTIAGAILGGLAGSLFGSEDEPEIGVYSSGEPSSKTADYSTWVKEISGRENRSNMHDALLTVFDAQFQAIEDAADWSLKEALEGVQYDASTKLKFFDNDVTKAMTEVSNRVFYQIIEPLVNAAGLSLDIFSTSPNFFEDMRVGEETTLEAFARFATLVESIDDFAVRVTDMVSQGQTVEEAVNNLMAINEIVKAVDASTEVIGTSTSINTVRGMIAAQDSYLEALREATATEEELAHVQAGIATQIGASISGLTANSLQSVLASGGDITGMLQATVKNTAAQTIAGLASESIMKEYGNTLNEMIGNAFKGINAEDLNPEELTTALNSILSDFDWEGMEIAAQSAADAINEFITSTTDMTDATRDLIRDGVNDILIISGRLTELDLFKQNFADKYGVAPSAEHSAEAIDYISSATEEEIQGLADFFGVTVTEMLQDINVEAGIFADEAKISADEIEAAAKKIADFNESLRSTAEAAIHVDMSLPDAIGMFSIFGDNASDILAGIAGSTDTQLNALGLSSDEASEAVSVLVGSLGEFTATSSAIASEAATLQKQILTLQGNTSALRALEFDETNAVNHDLLQQIHELTDAKEAEAAASQKAAEIASERIALEDQLFNLEHTKEEVRAKELDAIDSSNRALQKRIWALQDEAEAAEKAAGILNSRLSLEHQLYTLLKDESALKETVAQQRQIELNSMDESLRPLQERIWVLQDEAEAAEKAAAATDAFISSMSNINNSLVSVNQKMNELFGNTTGIPGWRGSYAGSGTLDLSKEIDIGQGSELSLGGIVLDVLKPMRTILQEEVSHWAFDGTGSANVRIGSQKFAPPTPGDMGFQILEKFMEISGDTFRINLVDAAGEIVNSTERVLFNGIDDLYSKYEYYQQWEGWNADGSRVSKLTKDDVGSMLGDRIIDQEEISIPSWDARVPQETLTGMYSLFDIMDEFANNLTPETAQKNLEALQDVLEKQVITGGITTDEYTALMGAAIDSYTDSLADAKLESVRDSAKADYISGLERELDILDGNLNDAKSTYLGLLNDELSAQESLVSALTDAIESIQDYRKALYIGEESPLSLSGRQEELMLERTILLAQAMSGDTDSMSDLLSVSSDYLGVAKQTSKTSLDYAREVALTNALLEDVENSAGEQLTEAEQQVQALEDIISGVDGTADAITNMDEARSAYESAKTEFDNNWYQAEIDKLSEVVLGINELKTAFLISKQAVVDARGTSSTAEQTLLEKVLSKASKGTDGLINFDWADGSSSRLGANFFTDNKLGLEAAAHDLGIPGFATGGSFQVTGAGGVDNLSLPQMRVTSGEMVNITRPDVMSGMSSELAGLRAEVSQLRAENKAHAIALIKSSQSVERNTDYLESWDVNGLPAEEAA